MFGRLNEAKRAKAVSLMNNMVHEIAKTLIAWSTDKEFFQTPKKPYIDELYILSTGAIYSPYIEWRKKRQDAFEDILLSSTNVYSDVYENYGGDGSEWRMKCSASSAGGLLSSIGNLVDERFREYSIAANDQLANVNAEIKKSRGQSDLSSELFARMNATTPFNDLVIRRLFDVDPNDRDQSTGYRSFSGQVMQFLGKRSDVFVQYLKQL
jgi:hypothetical protein